MKREALHLQWIHARLVSVHGENPNADYMRRLQEIAESLNGGPVTMRERLLETDFSVTRGVVLYPWPVLLLRLGLTLAVAACAWMLALGIEGRL
jgi:hypothetical protein